MGEGGEIEKDNGRDNSLVAESTKTNKGSSTLIEIWNIMWPGMPDTTPSIEPWKPQEFVFSQSKLIW